MLSPALLRLHVSIFVLNFMQVSLFLVVPLALVDHAGIAVQHHWMVYLPLAVAGFIIAMPGIIWAETRGLMRPILLAAIALLTVSMLGFAAGYRTELGLIVALFGFFIAFNLLEALLPSLASRLAPPARKGWRWACTTPRNRSACSPAAPSAAWSPAWRCRFISGLRHARPGLAWHRRLHPAAAAAAM